MEEIQELRKSCKGALEALLNTCDMAEELPIGFREIFSDSGMSLRDVLSVDLNRYIHYLSASDGRVSFQEVSFLNELLDLHSTRKEMVDRIEEFNIYSTEFEKTVPLSLRFFVETDNLLASSGQTLETSLTDLYLMLFKGVGAILITSDMDVDDQEQEDFGIYMNMLQNFVDQNRRVSQPKSVGTSSNTLKAKYQTIKKNK